MPGIPGSEAPRAKRSPWRRPTWYQMPGMLGGRCGSPAISGEPVALRAPETAQLLEPLASAARPMPRRTESICSTIESPSPLQASWVTTGLSAG